MRITPLNESAYETVFWPQIGEYANVTNFITEDHFEDNLDFKVYKNRIEEVAMFTDGIQMLALNFADRSAHSPFFEPMFLRMREEDNLGDLSPLLGQFLNSPKINERTDDDKTLILATRIEEMSA